MAEIIDKTKQEPEASVILRVVTSAMALVGILAASQLIDASFMLMNFCILGTIIGSYVSYKRRHSNNFVIKLCLAIGMLIVTAMYFESLITRISASVSDARIPLTNMLMVLLVLHCFDLPRRRDLSVSALVGFILMASAATLSRDLSFGIYLGIFFFLALIMFAYDSISRTLSKAIETDKTMIKISSQVVSSKQQSIPKLRLSGLLLLISSCCVLSGLAFLCVPRVQIRGLHDIQIATGIHFASLMRKSSALLKFISSDGSIRTVPRGYYGFSEELDTNCIAELDDQVVLRVSGIQNEYLRGMAYDTFDGVKWTMSQPKQTFKRSAVFGTQEINVEPVVGLEYNKAIPYKEITQVVYVEADATNLVVCAAVPSKIYFPCSQLMVDNYGSIRSPVGILKDMVYTVVSKVPQLPVKELETLGNKITDAADPLCPGANYLQLPPQLSPKVASLANKLMGKENKLMMAIKLCKYLEKHFKYDENAPLTPLGTDAVSNFLFQQKRGDCKHFASSFVIMCRVCGIPARLVTGYSPGTFNPFTGLSEIRLSQAHSWAEAYINNIGWMPFDPTPKVRSPGGLQGFPGLAFNYVEEEITRLYNNILESPSGKAISQELGKICQIIQIKYPVLVSLLPITATVLILGIVIIVVPHMNLYKWIIYFSSLSLPVNKQSFALLNTKLSLEQQEASRQYEKMQDNLLKIGVTRQISESPRDFLWTIKRTLTTIKIKDKKEILPLDRLIQDFTEFVDLYSAVRFGNYPENKKLKKLSHILSEKLKIVAKINKEGL